MPNQVQEIPLVIMCGGRGRRLGKLTEEVPKPLIKICGRPLLDIKVDEYLKQGLRKFIFCLGYKGEMIKEAASTYHSGDIEIIFSDSGETAGILKRFYETCKFFDEFAVMSYGDTFINLDIVDVINHHKITGNEVTIVVAPIRSPFGLVEIEPGAEQVVYFHEKPVLKYFIGHAVINKTAFDYIHPNIIDLPDGEGMVTFFKILIAMGKLGAFIFDKMQITFNTYEELDMAEKKLMQFFTNTEQANEK